MKARFLVLTAALALAAGAVGAGCAHEKNAEPMSGQKPEGQYLTGSYLPQDVQRNGPVTNGKSNVRVLDRSDIDQSGGADLRRVLREQGVTP